MEEWAFGGPAGLGPSSATCKLLLEPPLSYLLKRGETSAHRSELLWDCGMNENQTPESTSWDSIVNMSGWPPQATIPQFMSGKCPWKTTSRAELRDHPGVPGGESIQPEFHDFPWESPWHWKTELYFLFSPIRFVPVNLWNGSVFPDLMNTFSLSPTTVTGSSQALLWCSAWALYWHQRLPDIEKSLPHLHRSLDPLTFRAQFKTHVFFFLLFSQHLLNRIDLIGTGKGVSWLGMDPWVAVPRISASGKHRHEWNTIITGNGHCCSIRFKHL